MRLSRWRFALPLAALLTVCHAAAADLTVSAASSLTQAFKEIAPLFEARHPGTTVRLNFGASGALLQQIDRGAPVDVFASADQETMDQAQARSLVPAGAQRPFASNRLVVVVPTDAAQRPASLADLAGPAYARIAMGVPASVPVGRYTQAALVKAGLWAAIEPKVIGAQNVRQALDYVARGEVDAGFVYATDAALMRAQVAEVLTVPTAVPVRYPAAPVTRSPEAAQARAFVAFLASPAAQAVLAAQGFGPP